MRLAWHSPENYLVVFQKFTITLHIHTGIRRDGTREVREVREWKGIAWAFKEQEDQLFRDTISTDKHSSSVAIGAMTMWLFLFDSKPWKISLTSLKVQSPLVSTNEQYESRTIWKTGWGRSGHNSRYRVLNEPTWPAHWPEKLRLAWYRCWFSPGSISWLHKWQALLVWATPLLHRRTDHQLHYELFLKARFAIQQMVFAWHSREKPHEGKGNEYASATIATDADRSDDHHRIVAL